MPNKPFGKLLKSIISTKLPFFEKEKSEVLFEFESKTITNP